MAHEGEARADYVLLRDSQVVGTFHGGQPTDLPADEAQVWETSGHDLTGFQAALGPGYALLPVSDTPGSPLERRVYHLFHNGAHVGALEALFLHGEYVGLFNEAAAFGALPGVLVDYWHAKGGDLSRFLLGMEEEERRFNYMESLPDETREELAREIEDDKLEIARHWERGLAMRDRFLLIRALRELELAAALCDKYAMVDLLAELCNEMGNIYLAFEEPESAIEVFEEGLGYGPADVVSQVRLLTNMSQAYDLAGKRAKAIETIEAALTILPPDIYDSLLAGVYAQAAALYSQEGNHEKAIQLYKLAVYLADHSASVSAPEKAMVHNNLGMAYLEQDDAGAARAELEKAVLLQPEDPFYRENLARLDEELT